MIKNIIFDIGGVIIFHDKKLMSKIFHQLFPNGFDEAILIWKKNKDLLNTGKMTSKELIGKINTKINLKVSNEYLHKKYIDLYKQESANTNTELLRWIKENKNIYNVFSLSDTIDAHLEHNMSRKIFDDFQQTFNSNIEGIAKSEGEKAFVNLINKTKIIPEESIFVDDSPANIQLAKNLGFKTIQYITYENFQLELNLHK